jgi:single-strand DNA-binding protein
MAGSLNQVILIGRVGKDPEVRNTQSGDKIVNLSVATSERWKDKNSGEQKERTEWHRVVIFNDHIAGVAERFVKKGSLVHIEGALATRKWTDQAGVEKYTTEVVIQKFGGRLTLLSDRDGESGGGGGDRAERPAAARSFGGGGRPGGYPPEGGAAPRQPAGSGRPPSGGGFGGGGDLDDEIPFAPCWQ